MPKINKNIKSKKKKVNLFSGKYSRKLTKRKPRKKLKNPYKVFKDRKSRELIKKIMENVKPKDNIKRSNFFVILTSFAHKMKSNFNFNILKNSGKKVHVFLPETGMGGVGYFYKSFLEQFLPKARVSFLVTPSSKVHTTYSSSAKTKGIKHPIINVNANKTISKSYRNLKTHLKKSLNKHDKYFVVIDLYYIGRTYSLINKALKDLYKKDQEVLLINSLEDPQLPSKKIKSKDPKGKHALPLFEDYARELGILNKNDKKNYKGLKRFYNVVKYTYYYLGFDFAKNKYLNNIIKEITN